MIKNNFMTENDFVSLIEVPSGTGKIKRYVNGIFLDEVDDYCLTFKRKGGGVS